MDLTGYIIILYWSLKERKYLHHINSFCISNNISLCSYNFIASAWSF